MAVRFLQDIYVSGQSVFEGGAANWGENTQGTSTGTIHIDPGVTTTDFGGAITFGASDSGNGATAQAGIYTRTDGNYGTKMYLATTNNYTTGAQTAISIMHNGRVGIGNSNPSQELHVTGNIKVTGAYYDSNNTAGTSGQVLSSTATGTDWVSLSEISGVDGTGVANKLAFFSDANTIDDTTLHWDSANGRLGVGTTVPSYPVDIQSELDMGGGTFHYDHINKRIGINTISPDTKLEVNGETKTKNLSYASTTTTGQYHGEIVTFGTFVSTGTPGNNGAIAEGDVIVYMTNGLASGWTRAQGSTAFGKGMLGVAMGTSPSDGILIKGFARNTAFASGGLGDPLYLDASNAGDTTNAAPNANNNIVRIVGYMLNSTNDEIFFDPDKSWVQITA